MNDLFGGRYDLMEGFKAFLPQDPPAQGVTASPAPPLPQPQPKAPAKRKKISKIDQSDSLKEMQQQLQAMTAQVSHLTQMHFQQQQIISQQTGAIQELYQHINSLYSEKQRLEDLLNHHVAQKPQSFGVPPSPGRVQSPPTDVRNPTPPSKDNENKNNHLLTSLLHLTSILFSRDLLTAEERGDVKDKIFRFYSSQQEKLEPIIQKFVETNDFHQAAMELKDLK
jgi:TolA-binding protein